MNQPKASIQVSGGTSLYIDASRSTVMTSTSVVVPLRCDPGAHPAVQLLEEVDEVLRAVEGQILVADQVAQGRQALDLVADVGRRTVSAGVAVVHDRERDVTGRRARRAARVGRGRHPAAQPVAGDHQRTVDVRAVADLAIEDREDLAGELLLTGAVDRAEDLRPVAGVRPSPGPRRPAGARPRAPSRGRS